MTTATRCSAVLITALVLVHPGVAAQPRHSRGKFEPPPGKAMVLIGCEWNDAYHKYKQLTGDQPAGGVFWYEFNGDTTFFWHNAKDNVGPDGVLAIHIGPRTKKDTQDLLAGRLDENIRKLGAAFKEWGHPLFVAIGPEFDHKDNRPRYTAAQFVSFYRRVHRIWDEMGIINVAFVWHSCVENLGEGIWAFYPGDEYVDWFGISLYWPDQFRAAPGFAKAARGHDKPLMVMESSSINGKTASFEDWHGPYLRACFTLGARVICYNNFRDNSLLGEPFKNSAFDQLPRPIAEAWGRAMKSPSYLHASPTLYETLVVQDKADAELAVGPPMDISKQAVAQDRRATPRLLPPKGKTLVAIGGSWDKSVEAYTRATGHRPQGLKFFAGLNTKGDVDFFRRQAGGMGGVPGGFLATSFYFDPVFPNAPSPPSREKIRPYWDGDRDAIIDEMGRAIKDFGGLVFADLGGEFDINHRGTPQEFVSAFRHVHDRWDRLGVSNVFYAWHSGLQADDQAAYYPGDKYVDVIAFSAYERGGMAKGARLVRTFRKPGQVSAIFESGLSPRSKGDSSWDGYYRPLFELAESLDIRLLCYNNFGDDYGRFFPEDDPFRDTQMDRMPRDIQASWGRMMRTPRFRGPSPAPDEGPGNARRMTAQEPPKPEVAPPARGKPINLLPKIDPKRDVVQGDWRMANKVLAFAGDKEWSRIQVPYQPPEEYDLTVVAERVRGTEILIIGLVVGGHQATVVLDGWGGGVSGLERIDGKVSQDNETTHRGWRFANGKPTTIVCRVRKRGVAVTCDGETIFDWKGDAGRLSIVGGWKVPDDRQLFLGGWKGGAYRFPRLEVREVSADGVAAVLTVPGANTPTTGGKFCPPKGKRLLIIGQDRDSMTAYVRDTGQVPGGFMSYNHLQAFDGLMGIKPRSIDGLHDFHIVKVHPNTVLQVGLVFKGMEKEIARGLHDDRLYRLAEWFKQADVPIYLRVGPEFDLPADNGFGWPTYEPEPYKLAFRHVVDRFRKAGADNVAFVWHSAAWRGVEKVWASYPGDDYVDWFAVSLFGRENDEGAALFARYARHRGKPLMIAEATPLGGLAGTRDGVHTWDGWFRPFFEYIEKNDVRVVCFIPIDWESIKTYRGKGWRDARVQVVPEIKRRWLAEVGQAKYLKAATGLFETLGYRRRTDPSPGKGL